MRGTSDERPAIRIGDAIKTYASGLRRIEIEAVRGVTITVRSGAIHGLLGPNGAGKTTTLKMLVGLVRPTSGTFEVLGEDATRPRGRRALGFLPEQPYFPQHITGGQALALYGQLAGISRDEARRRTPGLLARVGLEGRDRTTIDKFSRGMLQRLGIAQALLSEPRVLVLDEPASGLDPIGQRDIRNLMLALRDEGVTVLLSSHQLSEVEAVCDQVTIMHAGRVAAEGDLQTLLNVSGQTSLTVRGLDSGLPESVAVRALDVATSGGTWQFSVADTAVREVVDAVDDVGGSIVSVQPKRASLEDYFAALLASTGEEVAS